MAAQPPELSLGKDLHRSEISAVGDDGKEGAEQHIGERMLDAPGHAGVIDGGELRDQNLDGSLLGLGRRIAKRDEDMGRGWDGEVESGGQIHSLRNRYGNLC